jgi:hypothetical protein
MSPRWGNIVKDINKYFPQSRQGAETLRVFLCAFAPYFPLREIFLT